MERTQMPLSYPLEKEAEATAAAITADTAAIAIAVAAAQVVGPHGSARVALEARS